VVVLGGHHLHSGADVIRNPNGRSPDRTSTGRRTRSPNESEPVAPPPTRSGAPTGGRIVRGGVLGNGRLGPAGAPPIRVSDWRASPLIAHREKRDMAASMCGWKGAAVAADRYGSRRRRWVGSRLVPRESVPENSSTPNLGDGGGGVAVRGCLPRSTSPPGQTVCSRLRRVNAYSVQESTQHRPVGRANDSRRNR
jgi:hypothetical protein